MRSACCRSLVLVSFVGAILACASAARSQDRRELSANRRARPVHTYSIVARDPKTGQLGVGVQSHYFSVGGIVPWAEPGVGAVATQSLVEVSYGPRGLNLMRSGKSAPEALKELVAKDQGRDVRQVAMIDAQGRVAAHTGRKCIAEAGHETGEQFSVQANLMLRATVPDAMARAYRDAEGDLADRILAALRAAEKQGGDLRGRQSAAILVVSGQRSNEPWKGKLFDLRVEDHPDPLEELGRLVRLQRAYRHVDAGDTLAADGRMDAAAREYDRAARLAPDVTELVFWQAVGLFSAGEEEAALVLFKKCFEEDGNWAILIPRLTECELLDADEEAVKRILAQKPND